MQAYKEALDIYEENSLVTYSLFSEAQRSDLLQAIDEAFHALIDTDKRAAYNQTLIETGQVGAEHFEKNRQGAAAQTSSTPKPIPAAVKHRDIRSWVKKKAQEDDIRRMAEEITGKDLVSGNDLKRLREAFGIGLVEIFELTRITTAVLTMIEENQHEKLPADIFLKGFLKSYAEILQIDPQRTVGGYLKYKSLSTTY